MKFFKGECSHSGLQFLFSCSYFKPSFRKSTPQGIEGYVTDLIALYGFVQSKEMSIVTVNPIDVPCGGDLLNASLSLRSSNG